MPGTYSTTQIKPNHTQPPTPTPRLASDHDFYYWQWLSYTTEKLTH